VTLDSHWGGRQAPAFTKKSYLANKVKVNLVPVAGLVSFGT